MGHDAFEWSLNASGRARGDDSCPREENPAPSATERAIGDILRHFLEELQAVRAEVAGEKEQLEALCAVVERNARILSNIETVREILQAAGADSGSFPVPAAGRRHRRPGCRDRHGMHVVRGLALAPVGAWLATRTAPPPPSPVPPATPTPDPSEAP